MDVTQPSHIRRVGFAGFGIGIALILSACGGGSAKTGSPTTGATSTTVAASTATAARAKYTQCLESHGVPASEATSGFFGGGRRGAGGASGTPPTSTSPGTSFTRPTLPAQYQAAFTTCRSDLPTGGGFGGGAFGGGLNSPQTAAYRECLEVHGVTLPTTPSTTTGSGTPGAPGGGGFGGSSFASLRNNPTFQAAEKACATLLPAGTGSTTTTTVATAS